MSELPGWAENLDLAPHPEGGWYRETWRSDLTLGQPALPPEYTGPRSAGTAILFLLMPGQQSAWHTGRGATTHLLGGDVTAGEQPQFVVPPGHWQRAVPRDAEPALVSCVVVPGFDFADFALGAPTD